MNRTAMNTLEYPEIIRRLSDQALSESGKRLCEALLPDTDPGIVRIRLNETTETRRLTEKGGVPLSNLSGMERVMEKLGKTVNLTPEELTTIRSMNRNVGRMMRFMRDRAPIAPTVSTYAASMSELEELSAEIDRCIVDNRVDDRASAGLGRVRKRAGIVGERIRQKLDSLMNATETRDMLQDRVIGMRGSHYVVPVKREHRQKLDGQVLDISSSGSTVFIEPAAIRALKQELDLLRLEEEQEVYRILATLTATAEAHARELRINLETMAQYDFLFARARLGNDMKAVCPEMTDDGVTCIVKGRHPLLTGDVVPLEFHIGDGYRALVITGPNTGGKTVVLKTVGLFTLMAQAGLHVPSAEGTRLAMFDDVLADIGDGQSIAQSLSTFSSHIRNIIGILACAGPRTLAIVDELGTGTDPGEGMGLAVAVMETLYRKGATLLATTHYSEIKAFAATHEGFRNGCMGFNVETLRPRYELSIGVPGESNAFLISLRLGMDPAIVERAHAVTYNEMRSYREVRQVELDARAAEEARRLAVSTPSTGHDIGQDAGRADGRTASRSAGLTVGQATGSMTGQSDGRTSGQAAGQSDGRTSGQSAGRTSGQSAGQENGMTAAPRTVLAAATEMEQNALEIRARSDRRHKAHMALEAEKRRLASPYKIGDCVFVTTMNRTGIVCEVENARGEIGVMILRKKVMVNAKRIRPFIDGKDLYPDDYDMSIVLDTVANRKARHQMGKRHVEGLQIVTPAEREEPRK